MEQISKRLMNWASILEDNTREQAEKTASMPFIFPHVALMPDAHLGKGATVGSVIPTVGAIIPAAVGVDIGCGMMAVLTQFSMRDLPDGGYPVLALQQLHHKIASRIPLSAGKYNQSVGDTAQNRVDELVGLPGADQADVFAPNWPLQLGSLGSGNHFIEVSLDEEDRVWLFLHSGSRGVGNKLAQEHIKVAQGLAERYFIPLPDPDLAYLVEGTPEFNSYLRALNWAQRFAYLNREEMMDRVILAFEEWIGMDVVIQEAINCHHNYTQRERHFGREVWLSRKGAISAEAGQLGLIPGSMGDASYVVEGLGNRLALNSSPHGAGRVFSRARARKTFTYEQLAKRMEGVAWGDSAAFLDEHPNAYKDIDVVMQDAVDLVRPLHTLRQIVNVKGA
jgi:tRNA-splicing ligase RtcB